MKRVNLTIGTGDIDQFRELSMPSYFMMMQKIACDDAEERDVGFQKAISKGICWIISRIEVDIDTTPKYMDDVAFETYPGDDLKILFPRYYRMFDKNGKQVIRSSSIWALLDIKTRTPVPSIFADALPAEHYPDELPLPKKVKIPEESSLVESRKVRYSEIDLNGHLNNTKYMDFVLDVHDSKFYKENRIKHIAINYTHEVKDEDIVDIYSSGGNPEVISGKVGDKLIFACELTYERRK